jgi:hypothetical protein
MRLAVLRQLAIAAIVGLTLTTVALAQSPAKPRGACSLLTKADVKKIAGVKEQFFDQVAPREEPLGGAGSSCSYSGIHIQVDPFSVARLEDLRKQKGNAWVSVPGVGDAAYLFDNNTGGAHYAELYARAGQHVITVQMSVRPAEASVETVRPQLVALAQALIAKLR